MADFPYYIQMVQNAIGNEYLFAMLLVVLGFILSRIFRLFIISKIKKLTEKTETDINDKIIGLLEKPAENATILFFLYYASASLSVLKPYTNGISEIFFVAFTLWGAQVVQKILELLIHRWIKVKNPKYQKSPELVIRVLNGVVYVIAFLIILNRYKIEITPLIAALGVGGLAVGLALQDSLSNFFAGLYIISGSSINVGDFIEIPLEKVSGYVEDINWRSTKIKTITNSIIIVPNSKLSQSIVVNTNLPNREIVVTIDCGVSYGSDLEKVERVTLEVAQSIQNSIGGEIAGFKPYLRFHTFADSNINFTIYLRVSEFPLKLLITHEFIKALKKRFDQEGIEISYPVRNVYYKSALEVKTNQIKTIKKKTNEELKYSE